jgi:hypothetical protein
LPVAGGLPLGAGHRGLRELGNIEIGAVARLIAYRQIPSERPKTLSFVMV